LSIEIQSRVANFLFQLQALNQRLQGIAQRKRGVGPIVGREILGETVGAIAENLFESSGVGDLGYTLSKRWIRQKQAEQNSSELVSAEYELKQILEQARELLSTVSVDSSSLKFPGNSDRLVAKMKRIASLAKPETRIVRAIQFLQTLQAERLILNSDLPEAVSSRKIGYQEAYGLLRNLEGALRKLIEESLSPISADWWTSRIPDDVREKAEGRKKQAAGNLHPVHYVDFPDYVKIIRKKDNWREAFNKILKDEEWISVKVKELEPIRNALAHSRTLPRGGLEKLRINVKDILNLIRATDP